MFRLISTDDHQSAILVFIVQSHWWFSVVAIPRSSLIRLIFWLMPQIWISTYWRKAGFLMQASENWWHMPYLKRRTNFCWTSYVGNFLNFSETQESVLTVLKLCFCLKPNHYKWSYIRFFITKDTLDHKEHSISRKANLAPEN